MENLDSNDIDEEEGENISEKNSQEEKDEKWNLNFEKEKLFWTKTTLPQLVYIPEICPKCKKSSYRI